MEEARLSQSAWDLLPSELWLAIFEYLPFPDIVKVKLICTTWSHVASDDAMWKARVQSEVARITETQFPSWYEEYKNYVCWQWGDLTRSPAYMLFMAAKIHREDRQIASYRTHQEIHGKAIAMSNHTIPPGDELDRVFHIKVISVGSLFAVGISDDTFPELGIYSGKNHGIGWYAAGGVWSDGRRKWKAVDAYTTGDVLSLKVCLRVGSLEFFKNGTKIGTTLDIRGVCKPLHITCLLGMGSSARLRYAAISSLL